MRLTLAIAAIVIPRVRGRRRLCCAAFCLWGRGRAPGSGGGDGRAARSMPPLRGGLAAGCQSCSARRRLQFVPAGKLALICLIVGRELCLCLLRPCLVGVCDRLLVLPVILVLILVLILHRGAHLRLAPRRLHLLLLAHGRHFLIGHAVNIANPRRHLLPVAVAPSGRGVPPQRVVCSRLGHRVGVAQRARRQVLRAVRVVEGRLRHHDLLRCRAHKFAVGVAAVILLHHTLPVRLANEETRALRQVLRLGGRLERLLHAALVAVAHVHVVDPLARLHVGLLAGARVHLDATAVLVVVLPLALVQRAVAPAVLAEPVHRVLSKLACVRLARVAVCHHAAHVAQALLGKALIPCAIGVDYGLPLRPEARLEVGRALSHRAD
mmetsp:Transcript_20430/g.63351  ORF Transcript_20430/g.63351 Transcript_20430/m.63351 type:complete len:380 (+) Transcript_20430:1125-2264(+)